MNPHIAILYTISGIALLIAVMAFYDLRYR